MITIKTTAGDVFTARDVALEDAQQAMNGGETLTFVDTAGVRNSVAGDKIISISEAVESRGEPRAAKEVVLLILNTHRRDARQRNEDPRLTRMGIGTHPLWAANGWADHPTASTLTRAMDALRKDRLIDTAVLLHWLTESGIQEAERLSAA